MVDPHLLVPARVLWVLTTAYIANATATLPRGRGPPMDLGRNWPWDGRRLLGPSKTWAGFLFGPTFAVPFGLLQAYLILIAPPDLALVPQFGVSVLASLPLVLTLGFGALSGDAIGSFVKRRLGRESGARTWALDQLPFILLPVGIGLVAFPAVFVPTFASLEALGWLVVFTLGLHVAFNYIGYWAGWKKVPW
ncbi:MAG TPA: CDP-archaeol synthase [Thermoplasmata archaeon]|nr:CDP-archaeol synthase [Thermoplasmata archaeon]HEV2428909.1 CDP-archaeol synthase [Thermoplasmata archaeon]